MKYRKIQIFIVISVVLMASGYLFFNRSTDSRKDMRPNAGVYQKALKFKGMRDWVGRYGGISTEISTLRLGNLVLQLPNNMWGAPYGENYSNSIEEYGRSIEIHVLWPKWEGATEDNYFSDHNTKKDSMLYMGQESKYIRVVVDWVCRNKIKKHLVCDAKRRIKGNYDIYSGEGNRRNNEISNKLIYGDEEPNLKAPFAPNIEFVGFRQKTQKSMQGQAGINKYDRYIYMKKDVHDQIEYIECTILVENSNPGCTVKFIWKNEFLIKINFRLPLLGEWDAIKKRGVGYLESIIVKN